MQLVLGERSTWSTLESIEIRTSTQEVATKAVLDPIGAALGGNPFPWYAVWYWYGFNVGSGGWSWMVDSLKESCPDTPWDWNICRPRPP